MRTKTLLIAATALAATVISSEAQVYSANIVGYVNQTLTGNSAFTLITAPLQGTNGLNTSTVESLMPALDAGDAVYIWTGNGYYSSTYFGGPDGFLTPPNDWIDQNNVTTNSPSVALGQGFFYSTQSGNQETNTFIGTVVLTNSLPLTGNSAFTLVSSTPPIGGSLESTNFNLPLDAGDAIYVWTGNGYYSSTYFGGPDGFLSPPNDWIDQNNVTTNAPVVSVGQGFFYSTQSGNAETWNQSLIVQ
jgi:hypothetical protein